MINTKVSGGVERRVPGFVDIAIADADTKRLIITDDSLRVRMLAAHYLEYAELLYERGDVLYYSGWYGGTAIALISSGFGAEAFSDAVRAAIDKSAAEIIYLGVCAAAGRRFPLRSVILVEGGGTGLIDRASRCAGGNGVNAARCEADAIICAAGAALDNYGAMCNSGEAAGRGLETKSGGGAAALHEIEILYKQARSCGVEALAILTIAENTETGEKMEEHEQRSRLYAASQLAFETLSH